jgi:hypothetical protein
MSPQSVFHALPRGIEKALRNSANRDVPPPPLTPSGARRSPAEARNLGAAAGLPLPDSNLGDTSAKLLVLQQKEQELADRRARLERMEAQFEAAKETRARAQEVEEAQNSDALDRDMRTLDMLDRAGEQRARTAERLAAGLRQASRSATRSAGSGRI